LVRTLLEGEHVNLRIVEKEELAVFADFLNDLAVGASYMPVLQHSQAAVEEHYAKLSPDAGWFYVEKKDGRRIGWISHAVIGGSMTIEYALVPSARRQGYGTEAIRILVDYLFLSRDLVRIQAEALVDNAASQRVLEKVGFTREGIKRKASFVRGRWRDDVLFSILREEWKEPKVLAQSSGK
jgi:aminoglycoside 6'-N-acetyltransferase